MNVINFSNLIIWLKVSLIKHAYQSIIVCQKTIFVLICLLLDKLFVSYVKQHFEKWTNAWNVLA